MRSQSVPDVWGAHSLRCLGALTGDHRPGAKKYKEYKAEKGVLTVLN